MGFGYSWDKPTRLVRRTRIVRVVKFNEAESAIRESEASLP